MKIRNGPHLVGQGFVSFWRNGVMTTAAILVLICCMLVLGSFYAVIDNLNRFIDDNIEEIKVINAYIDADADTEEIIEKEELLNVLWHSSGSNISGYEHISKEQAKEMMSLKSDELARILAKYDEFSNPLPETFRVTFKDFDGVKRLLHDLEEIFGAENVENQVGLYDNVKGIRDTATMIGVWLMAVLLLVSMLVIMNTVKLTVHNRRNDIAIMRYIGATGAFIVAPFIVEGVIIGLVSTIISCGLQYYLYDRVVSKLIESYGAITLVPAGDYFPLIPLAFLAIGLFAGVVASAVSVKKHLDA